jgi:peptidoglycan hydrolase-like protein with peptidoglycan-binding domain
MTDTCKVNEFKAASTVSPGTAKLPFFQPKLTINKPNDVYEQEADAVADKVMRMERPGVQLKPLPIAAVQRKCAHCEEEEKTLQRKAIPAVETGIQLKPLPGEILQRTCAQCEEKEKKLQRKEINDSTTSTGNNLNNYVAQLNGNGQSLSKEVRNFYEPRFGRDFSNVRIHADNVAAKSAQSINALAYTSGNNIVFNNGQYAPGTDTGKRLLGHELTHVVQQSSPGSIQRKPLTAEEKKENLESDFLKDDARLQQAYDNSPLMAKSEKSEGVKTLQRALKRLNYEMPITFKDGDADGIFKDETKAVLQHFQRDNELNDDGVAGRDTLKALDSKFNPVIVVEAVYFPDDHRQLVNNETDWSFAGSKYSDWSDAPYHIIFDTAAARTIPISVDAGKKLGAVAKVRFKGGIPGENFSVSSNQSTGTPAIGPAFTFNGGGSFQNNNEEHTDFISLSSQDSVLKKVLFADFSLNWEVNAAAKTKNLPVSGHRVFVTAASAEGTGQTKGTDFPNIPTFKRLIRATEVAKNQPIDNPGKIAFVIIKKFPSYGVCDIPYDPQWDSATFKCPQLQSIWEMSDYEGGRGHFQCITIANYTKAVMNILGISSTTHVAVTPVVIWADPADPEVGNESLSHGYNSTDPRHSDWYLTLLDGRCGSNNFEACVKLQWMDAGVDTVQYYCGGVPNKEGGFKTPTEILKYAFIALAYVKSMSKNDARTGFPRGIRMRDLATYKATESCKRDE